jgi:hypothetical protein
VRTYGVPIWVVSGNIGVVAGTLHGSISRSTGS